MKTRNSAFRRFAAWLLLSAALLGFAPRSPAQSGTVSLPANVITVAIDVITTNIFLITNSFALVELGGVPGGYSVSNGLYSSWCVDAATPFSDTNYFVRLYDSLGTNLPVSLQAEPWSQINYILNHKLGGTLDIQEAIWYLQDGTPLVDIGPGPAQDMVSAARQFGTNYSPSTGQTRAIVMDPSASVQRLVIEIPNPPGGATNQVRLGLLRSNNTIIVSWPSPSTGFILQQNTNGPAGVNWSNLVTTPSDDGTYKSIMVTPAPGSRYFRLFKP
jgi:hypothetical protein